MGCTGSKNEAIRINFAEIPKTSGKNDQELGDDEVLELNPARVDLKKKVDEIEESQNYLNKLNQKNQSLNKTTDKNYEDFGTVHEFFPKEGNHVKNLKSLDQGFVKSKENEFRKGKTFAEMVNENHPHEFDFSFIEEKNKEDHEKDLITESVFKEISLLVS